MSSEQDLVDALYATFGAPVTLSDARFGLVAFSSHPPREVDELRLETLMTKTGPPPELATECRRIARTAEPAHVTFKSHPSAFARFVMPVMLDDICCGFLFFLDPDRRMHPADLDSWKERLVEVARFLAVNDGEDHTRSLLLNGLLSSDQDRQQSAQSLVERTVAFHDSREFTIAIIQQQPGSPPATTAEFYRLLGRNTLVSQFELHSVVLTIGSPHATAEKYRRWLAQLGGEGVRVGVGGAIQDLRQSPQRRQEAALALFAPIAENENVVCWDQIGGVWRLLLSIPERRLGVLVEPRVMHLLLSASADDLQLLEDYLMSATSVSRVADKHHIHRSTAYYRLQRLARQHNLHLDEAEERLLLTLALRMRRLHPELLAETANDDEDFAGQHRTGAH